jgi:hypothetical protein
MGYDYKYEQRRKKILATLGVIGAPLLWAGSCSVFNGVNYSDGVRVGVVNKFAKKGFVWKTYEGEMAQEGITSSGNQTGANIWEFSIDNSDSKKAEELASKLKPYVESGTKVRITYKQQWLSLWPRGGTSYYIEDVQPLNSKIESKLESSVNK